jgi:predicted ribonuclease toxin of YeeF-YezG toxin-antitoxin module
MMRQYLREMETITGVPIATEQRLLLKSALKEQKFVKIEGSEAGAYRGKFRKEKDNLIKEWEVNTGQKWPTYTEEVWGKCTSRPYKRVGQKYDAHEIIPNSHGGPLEWWNITPARSPDQHQKLIHGSGSTLNKILSEK